MADTIHTRIRARRKALGMKQKDMAAAMKLTPQAAWAWEHGGGIDYDRLPELAAVLETTVDYLMGTDVALTGYENSVSRIDSPLNRRVPLVDIGDMSMSKVVSAKEQARSRNRYANTNFPASDEACAFTMLDHSMEPSYQQGDIVIVDPLIQPVPGDHVVAYCKSQNVTIFRLFEYEGADHIKLSPLNLQFRMLRFTHEEWAQDIELIGVKTEVAKPRRIRHTL